VSLDNRHEHVKNVNQQGRALNMKHWSC